MIIDSDTLLNILHGIAALRQLVESEKAFCAGRTEGWILERSAVFTIELQGISHFLQYSEELPFRHGCFDRPIDIVPDQAAIGRSAVSLSGILLIILPASFRVLDHRKPVFQTKPVGLSSHCLIVSRRIEEFMAIDQGYWVKDQMIVIMICVAMCGNDHLIFISPQTLRQLHTDLMSGLRIDFTFFEGLISRKDWDHPVLLLMERGRSCCLPPFLFFMIGLQTTSF